MTLLSLTSRIYTYARRLMYIALILMMSFVSHASSSMISGENPSKTSVSFELVDGLIVVEASVQGQKGNFILDTGAPVVVLNQEVEKQEFELWTPQGDSPGKDITVDDFRFGTISKRSLDAWALDLSYLETKMNRQITGIVGNQIWDDHQLIIDYKNKLITFHLKGDDVAITTDQYHIASLPWKVHNDHLRVIQLEINGRYRQMAFDTGAGISVLDDDIEDSDRAFGEARLDNITIEQLPFTQSDLSILNDNQTPSSIDGILSASSLEADIVVLDFSNNRLHLCWDRD